MKGLRMVNGDVVDAEDTDAETDDTETADEPEPVYSVRRRSRGHAGRRWVRARTARVDPRVSVVVAPKGRDARHALQKESAHGQVVVGATRHRDRPTAGLDGDRRGHLVRVGRHTVGHLGSHLVGRGWAMSETDSLDDLPQPEYEGALATDELHVDGDNPNEMQPEQFELLCDRIEQRGWVGNAIIADTDGMIADGQHRWQAAKELGLEEVPVKLYDVSDAERRLIRQELNKIDGEHDTERDALEYDRLLSEGLSDPVEELTDTTGENLEELLNRVTDPSDLQEATEGTPDPQPNSPTEPERSKPQAPDEPKSPPDIQRGESDPDEEWDRSGTAPDTNEDLTPEHTVQVHFESMEDVEAFEERLNTHVHRGRMSTWYPPQENLDASDKYASTEAND